MSTKRLTLNIYLQAEHTFIHFADVDGRIENIPIDKVCVTSLLAKEGLLWVGVNQGLLITYPLPKLGGIPTVSGLASVSFHAHSGPVRQLHSFKIERDLSAKSRKLDMVKGLYFIAKYLNIL